MDTHKRTIMKAMTWRLVATLTTMVLVFIFTGSFVISIGVGVLEAVAKMILYYAHERVWNLTAFGQTPRK